MAILKHICAVAAFGLAAVTYAAPAAADRVTALLGSYHVGASGQFEEVNPGVFYTWERPWVDLSLGAYRNSYGKASVAGLVGKSFARWENGQISAFAGVAHYPGDGANISSHLGSDVVGLVGLQLRQGNFVVQALPLTDGAANGLLTFGLTFDIGE